VLAELKQRRVTTIIITHRRAVLEHVDKVLILRDGGVRAFGTREEMLAEVTPISAGGTALASTASSRRLQARG
jgi:ABC-type protease/lipase transport system fused ATPase/permease subunit